MGIIKTKSFELATYEKGSKDSKKIILLLPGQLDTKDYAHMISHVDFFADKGYFALSFDPPGTWESPGSIELYTMTNYLKAINELIEFFGNKPTVLMGHSRGGTMAMLAGANNEYVTHIIAVMSHTAPSELDKSQVKDGVKISYRDMPPNDTVNKKKFDLPINYFEDAKKHDVLGVIEKCKKPKLFFYGTMDVLVEPEDVKETFEVVPDPKYIHELNTEHDYRLHKNIVDEVNTETWKFLEGNK